MNTSLTAYLALKWSTLIILHGYKSNSDMNSELPKLIEAQANLSAAALASMDKKLTNKVYVLLAHQWSSVKDIDIVYLETLTKLEAGNGVIVLASLLTMYLVNAKKSDLVVKLKVNLYLITFVLKKLFLFYFL